jgi:hypothetical protein
VVLNTPEKENQNGVVFFLGAGASKEAGVPDTVSFIYGEKDGIQGFIEYLEGKKLDNELNVLKLILKTLEEKDNSTIDIELVLGTIIALNRKKNFELVYFYDHNTFKFNSEEERILSKLEPLLKGFIRKNVVVDKNAIRYLAPLTEFKPINIFSVNYDTCIEMLCIKHKLKYTDGFDSYWNPELLDSNKYDIKLFKLHGSILWYLTDNDNFVKLLPNFVKLLPENEDETDEIPLITDETAQPFIMYPIGGKSEYHRPLAYLTNKLENHLKLKETELCIVVGYSFRDEYIKSIFFDSAKENENLTIILIDPNAGRIFNEKLRYRDREKSIESPIADRVICFNYPFGSVLKNNYLYRVKNRISRISNWYSSAENEKKGGSIEYFKTNIKTCVNVAIEDAHVYFIEKIFEKQLGISPPDSWGFFNEEDQFRLSYSLAIFYLLNSDEKGKKYFEFLRDSLKDILDTGKQYYELNIELSKAKTEEAKTDIKIKIDDLRIQHPNSSFCYWPERNGKLDTAIQSFNDFIQSQLKFFETYYAPFTISLKATAGACYNLLEISRYDAVKYTSSEKVNVGSASVEVQRINDLEDALDNIIRKIEDFIEYFDKEV